MSETTLESTWLPYGDSFFPSMNHKRGGKILLKDSSGSSVTVDDYLWWLLGATETEKSELIRGKLDVPKAVKSLLSILDERHFDAKGNLKVDSSNRPYGHNVDDFTQTVPGSLVRSIQKAIQDAFPAD